MCGRILWVGEQNDSTALQSINTVVWRPFIIKEELKSVWDLSKVCSQIVLKCWNWMARIGRPDILWSVNKFARAFTKWTKACDKRLSRLISYTRHACEYKQYCHVWNTAQQCRLRLFQDSDFAGDVEDSKSTSVGTLCIFHTFVSISWMCQETNFSLAQFNRIRDHFFGCWIGIGRKTRTWFMGTDLFSFWKHDSEPHRTVRPVVEWKREVRSAPHTI